MIVTGASEAEDGTAIFTGHSFGQPFFGPDYAGAVGTRTEPQMRMTLDVICESKLKIFLPERGFFQFIQSEFFRHQNMARLSHAFNPYCDPLADLNLEMRGPAQVAKTVTAGKCLVSIVPERIKTCGAELHISSTPRAGDECCKTRSSRRGRGIDIGVHHSGFYAG